MATATTETVQVFEPYRYALPKLRPYLRDVWARREFAFYMARAELKGQHFDSVFGQFWLVLNPLLLGFVYFLLTSVLTGGSGLKHFVAILAGIFTFFYTRNIIQMSGTAITSGGRMIINMSFPKILLPVSAAITALLMYLPSLVLYALLQLTVHRQIGLSILWLIPIFLIQTVFSFGLGLFFSALTVYFRDLTTLLPYLLRIWMYLSPVLYSVAFIKDKVANGAVPHWILAIYQWDPLTPIINTWRTVLVGNSVSPFAKNASYTPAMSEMLAGTGWAVAALLLGAWFFMSREREFAVRV